MSKSPSVSMFQLRFAGKINTVQLVVLALKEAMVPLMEATTVIQVLMIRQSAGQPEGLVCLAAMDQMML